MCEQAKRLLAWQLSASLPGAMAAMLPWTIRHVLSSPHLRLSQAPADRCHLHELQAVGMPTAVLGDALNINSGISRSPIKPSHMPADIMTLWTSGRRRACCTPRRCPGQLRAPQLKAR